MSFAVAFEALLVQNYRRTKHAVTERKLFREFYHIPTRQARMDYAQAIIENAEAEEDIIKHFSK
jgi:hypothetical protein